MMPVYAGEVPVDHDSPVPLYRQVAALLRERKRAGVLFEYPSADSPVEGGTDGDVAERLKAAVC